MEEQILKQLAQPLLAWYDIHRRILPWREEVSPYRTWVSEIMLQQTRVAAVLPYFQRFMEAFPTVGTLAQADTERLMKLWEGLGYYSRARNLQKAARILTEQYGGRFPETYRELTALPGIGDYTAGDRPFRRWTATCCVWRHGSPAAVWMCWMPKTARPSATGWRRPCLRSGPAPTIRR
mgnify:CR=1 FL=1